MKIFIAVPTFETIQPEVFRAIYGLESEHELYFDFIKGVDVRLWNAFHGFTGGGY